MQIQDSLALLTEWFPDAHSRASLAGLVARSIRRAHLHAPASWEFTHRDRYARLNVGQIAVLELYRNQLALYGLATETVAVDGIVRRDDWQGYAAVSGRHALWHVAPDSIASLPQSICHAHLALIDAALTAKRRSPHKASHTRAVVEAIGQLSNTALDQPEYSEAVDVPHAESIENGGMFGDSEQNALVEKAAVRVATAHYEHDGWSVHSREAKRCGYDLECRRGTRVRHVEVKGRSSSDMQFVLTPGELRVAEIDPDFELAVVTNALSPAPEMHLFDGKAFLANFRLSPIRYVARLISERRDS